VTESKGGGAGATAPNECTAAAQEILLLSPTEWRYSPTASPARARARGKEALGEGRKNSRGGERKRSTPWRGERVTNRHRSKAGRTFSRFLCLPFARSLARSLARAIAASRCRCFPRPKGETSPIYGSRDNGSLIDSRYRRREEAQQRRGE